MRNILVIFQATTQETESLALAVGLGAVQAGANIRLRHLDPSPCAELAHAGYGTLKMADLQWAQGVAVILESGTLSGLGELKSAIDGLSADSRPDQKWMYLFHANPASDVKRFVQAMFVNRGFQRVKDDPSPYASLESMTQTGQKLARKE